MIEFGAKLSLKDNMYAVLQKNITAQKKFTDQIKKTHSNLKAMARTKVAPIIQAKDKASAVLKKVKNTLKSVGKTIAKPFVVIKDGATKILNKIWTPLKKMGSFVAKPLVALKDGATKALKKIKDLLKTVAKGATIALGVAGAGAGAVLGGSISEGAKLQQSVGGVETLYKGDAGAVVANADKAFKTAGLSANAYMETVTSFSASLLQSLGGDTAKSAQMADMAIIDMADNANKFGTDMSSIQTAYQGFAKQNYTMLDNLKLGYGGTKEEMQRLLKDAQKISGVKYNISNLSDVYSAIHVIQEDLGVTGATAKEASTTFTGSFNAMKASISNVFGNLATGGDITGSMEAMVDSASTFLFDNFVPMLSNIFTALPSALKTGISKALPKIKESGKDIARGIKDGLMALLPTSVTDAFGNVFGSLKGLFSDISGTGLFDTLAGYLPTVEGLLNGVASAIQFVSPAITSLGSLFNTVLPIITNGIKSAMPMVQEIFNKLSDRISTIAGVIQKHSGLFTSIISAFQTVAGVMWDILFPVVDAVISVIDGILTAVETAFPTIQGIIGAVWDFLEPVFSKLADGLSAVGDAIGGVAEFVGNGIATIGSWFGFAYGKDRVPYDNYPAILHQGEKVLTRNQADQYERQMSTRGVTVSGTLLSPNTGASGGGGNNITIEKLADTVVIEKDADVDKVVEGMVAKFRQLVPNMA